MSPPRSQRQPLLGLALAAVLGILLAEWMALPVEILVALGAAAALFCLWRPRTLFIHLLVIVAFCALHRVQETDSPGRQLAQELGPLPRAVVVRGTVTSETKAAGAGFNTFFLRLETIQFGGREEKVAATVRVRWKGAPELGDELRLSGLAEPIPPERNPGVFDLRAYLARRGIFNSIFARYLEDGTVVRPAQSRRFFRFAAATRRWMQQSLNRGLEDSPPVCSLINGMALGLRHETPDDIEEPFQQTGTLHLFAVAGLHVGIIAQLLWIVARLCRLPRVAAAALIIPFLFFYSAVTGAHVSSVRAATMAAVLLGGIFFGRRVLALNSLAAAALLILAVDPNQLFSSGFQLSFAVVGAIILCQERIFQPLVRLAATDPFLPRSLVSRSRLACERGYAWIARAVSISSAAWLGSFVLILWYFYLVTPVSLLANLAVVPVAFAILAVAMMSLLAASFSSALSVVFNNANWTLSRVVLGLVQLFAQLPGGHLYVEQPHWPRGALAEITVLDAGAGAAVHLRADHADWLLDCGSVRNYEGFLRDYLHSRGINRLDGLILSHGDSLHIGGAAQVLEEFRPRHLIDNAAPDRSRVHHSLVVRQGGREAVAAGASIALAPDVVAHVLYPPARIKAKAADDAALVLRLDLAGRGRVLLVADSGAKTEAALLLQPDELASDILVKGQHYSGESGSASFLAAVHPRVIIATSVDFPTRERLPDAWAESVQAQGIRLFRQDKSGAVQLRFYRDHWEATPFLEGATFTSSSR